jgi:hypothetical protein
MHCGSGTDGMAREAVGRLGAMRLFCEQAIVIQVRVSEMRMSVTPKEKLATAEKIAAGLRDMQREVLEAREPSLGMLVYLIAMALSEAESQVALLTKHSGS